MGLLLGQGAKFVVDVGRKTTLIFQYLETYYQRYMTMKKQDKRYHHYQVYGSQKDTLYLT